MNTFFSIDAATAWHVIGFAVDLAIKATIALLAALAVAWGARRRSAALRHRVWFLTYGGLLLLPVLPLAMPKWQIPLPSAFDRFRPEGSQIVPTIPQETSPLEPAHQDHRGWQLGATFHASSRTDDLTWPADAGSIRGVEHGWPSATTSTSSPSVMTSPSIRTPMPALAVPPPTRLRDRSVGLTVGGLILIWLVGVAVSVVSVFAARHRGRQLLNLAEPVRDPRWLELLEELRKNLRVTSRVRLLESAHAVVPMATGVVHQAVLLPRETEAWPPPLRRHVLIHELAHVRRRDVLQHLICRLTVGLYWFHPLAWYGVRRMRLEREIACDDCVLMAGEHPCDYAAELVGIARQLHGIATPWAVCVASGSTLEERVRSMLDRARSHGPLSVAAARSLLIVALAAIALLAAVEPGTSSVRKPKPASAGIVNESLAGESPVKESAPLVDRKATNTILAQANDKQSVVSTSTVPVPQDPTFSFAGTVVDPEGRPVADAKISLSYFPAKPPAFDVPAAVSDLHGRFAFSRKKSDFADLYPAQFWSDIRMVAVKQGFGFASVPAMACETTGRLAAAIHELKNQSTWQIGGKGTNVLTLVADDLPIRGRLLTIDGRPVPGAKIAVVGVWAGDNGSLDAFEAKLKESPAWQHITALFRGYVQAGGMMYQGDKRWYRGAAAWNERRPSIVAPVQSDADGRFTITGLGRERMAEILITAPGFETTLRFVRTRRGTVLRMGGGPNAAIHEQIEPSEFSLVLGPSILIEGRVVDAKTRQPLAGVRVQPTSTVFAHAFSDAQGRYRIEALPPGDNDLEIIPPKGSRYLPGGVTVKAAAGSHRVVRDIALAAGILVHGRVIDERTHQPVSGSVQYFAFEPNPLLANTDSLDPLITWNKVAADAEGRFEIAALPGAGILGFEGARFKGAPGFPHGVGADRIQGPLRDTDGRYKEFRTVPDFCSPNSLNLVVPLNPRADDRDVALDLKLRSGVDVPVHLAAFDGRPVSAEFYVVRDGRPDFRYWRSDEGRRFTVAGYFPTEKVRLEAYDPGRNLVGTYELTGLPPATVTITLSPGASIAGRVLDEEGLPIPFAPVGCDRGRHATADAQGRFELKGLLPESKYSGWTVLMRGPGNRRQRDMFDLFTDVTAQKGEAKQLGDLRLKPQRMKTAKKRTGAPKGPKTTTSKTSQQAPRDSKQVEPASDKTPLRIAGRVLDPNGKPAAEVTVRIHAILGQAFDRAPYQSKLLASVTTDESGRFEHSLDWNRLPLFDGSKYPFLRGVATKPGFGMAFKTFVVRGSATPVDFQLVPDEPVRGRVLNLEGRPIAGARVEVTSLQTNTEMMKTLRQMEAAHAFGPYQLTGMERTSPAMLPSATTDSDGRFEIVGLGRDRLVGLRMTGPQIAVGMLHVATQPIKPLQIRLKWGLVHQFYGSQFEFVAEPSVPLEGTVQDEESGAPIAGAIIASYRFAGEKDLMDSDGLLSTTSNAHGRFKLEGLPLSDKNSVRIIPPDLPYLAADDLSVPRGIPPRPISQDFKLRRCVWAAGRVRDVKTGKPAIGRIYYTPFHSNEFAKLYSHYQKGFRNRLEQSPAAYTDEEGRFRIPVIPGRGVLCFKSYQGHYSPGKGAAAIKELAEFKPKRNRVGPTFDDLDPRDFQALCEINPPAATTQIDVDVPVDSGQDVVLKFVDRSGNRLTGLRASGSGLLDIDLLPRGPNADRAVVRATSPGETRTFWIKHEATGLSKFLHFTAKPGESERTITLEPPALLTGRLMSADGHPLVGRSINCMNSSGGHPVLELQQVRTDARGGFRCEIPSGGPFELYSYAVGYAGFAPLARQLTVQAGEQIDFGELVVNVGEDSMITVTAKNAQKRTKPPAADPQMGNRPQP